MVFILWIFIWRCHCSLIPFHTPPLLTQYFTNAGSNLFVICNDLHNINHSFTYLYVICWLVWRSLTHLDYPLFLNLNIVFAYIILSNHTLIITNHTTTQLNSSNFIIIKRMTVCSALYNLWTNWSQQ